MIAKIKKFIWKAEGMDGLITPADSKGNFKLTYNKILIGTLRFENGYWFFEYSPEFISQKSIAPIMDFPDIDKKYQNEELWPFFAARIPNLNQPFHQKKIIKANIDSKNEVSLLKVFGKDIITNPFRLSPV